LVYFAKRKLDYKRVKKEDVSQFEKNKGDKILAFEIASKDLFVRQLKQSDIIYLHGGKTLKLLAELKKVPNLRQLLGGKVVAGESAGAYVLSSCFYSKSEKGVFEGLGFVPVKTICHYIGKNKDKLKQCQPGLKELLLGDYQYRVFEI
jgi:peptidase E